MGEIDEKQGTDLATTGRTEVTRHPEVDVGGLLSLAVEKDLDVEKLGKLVELQERILERDARAAFFEALADFQEACPPLRKVKEAKVTTRSGGRYGYMYAPLDEIQRTIRPHLREFGLAYSWDESLEAGMITVVCTLRHVLGHSESSSFTGPTASTSGASEIQKVGIASTYSKRRSLLDVIGIAAEDDTDGGGAGASVEKITAADVKDIEASIAMFKEFDRGAFLNWLGVAKLAELTRDRLPAVRAALDKKAQKEAEA